MKRESELGGDEERGRGRR
jgi:hypothetical protein